MILKEQQYYWVKFKEPGSREIQPALLLNGEMHIVGQKQSIPLELFELTDRIRTPNEMLTVYIAGSYRWRGHKLIPPIIGEFINTFKAWKVARKVWSLGFVAVCPHTNAFLMDRFGLSPDTFLKGDFLILKQCDCILMMPEWQKSSGAREEHNYAVRLGIPVYYSISDLTKGAFSWR